MILVIVCGFMFGLMPRWIHLLIKNLYFFCPFVISSWFCGIVIVHVSKFLLLTQIHVKYCAPVASRYIAACLSYSYFLILW